jgi:hypothetical protein
MSAAKVAAQTNKKIEFPTWIPQGAQRRIAELSATPLGRDNEYHALLERLSKYPAMKTEVWEKLPSRSKGFEEIIIDWAFNAFTTFPHLPRPYPKTKSGIRDWAIHRKRYPTIPDPAHVAGWAYRLLEGIIELKAVTDSDWSRLWGGDKSITSDEVLAILDQLRLFYLRFNNEHQTRLAKLPEIKRWSKKAWQKFFTEYLSKRFKETYLQPFDSIVAALAEVAFDLPNGIAAETIRGRRRRRVLHHRKNRRKKRA